MSYKIIDYTDKYDGLMQFNKNKNKYIHQWYSFVEGYSKEFIESVLDELPFKPKICLEPFSGSGTTPLELQKKQIKCISFEVNPFMHKLSQVKMTTTYTNKGFNKNFKLLQSILNSEISINEINSKITIPKYKSIVEKKTLAKWIFNKDIFDFIIKIKYSFTFITDQKYKNLFEIILASILLKYSNVYRNGKCLSYKKNWKLTPHDKNELYKEFINKLHLVKKDIVQLNQNTKSQLFSNKQYCSFGDIRKTVSKVDNESVDLIITSPPYLNSRDYTDIYMIELWMFDLITGYDKLQNLRKTTFRSHVQVPYENLKPLNIKLLKDTLEKLKVYEKDFWNKNLLNMIIGYFEDMNILFSNLKNKLTTKGKIYFNVANSAYYGVLIEVDKIIAEIATLNGLIVEEIRIARNLKSSGQQKDIIGTLRESVIVIKK